MGVPPFSSDYDPSAYAKKSADERGLRLHGAAQSGSLNIIIALLKSGEISNYTRGDAILYAIQRNCTAIVTALLSHGEISINHRGEAVNSAIAFAVIFAKTTPDMTASTALLAHGEISINHRSDAVEFAAQKGLLQMMTTLLTSGETAKDSVAKALTQTDDVATIRVLKRYQACQDQATSIQEAIQAGNTDVAKDLLATTPLISWQTAKLLTTAIDSKNLEIIEVILKSGSYIRPHDFGIILDHAAASDDADITHRIFDLTFCSKRFSKPPFFQKILTTFPAETVLQLVRRSSYTQPTPKIAIDI